MPTAPPIKPTSVEPAEAQWQPTPDAAFRHQAPAPGAEAPWEAPIPLETRLSNGMRVWFIARPALPIVAIQVTSPRGADQQPSPGMGAFLGAMLEQGTTTRNALQVSDAYLDIGASHGAWVDWDSTNAWIQVLPQHLDRGIEILADVFRNPSFAAEEVQRVRSQTIASIRQQNDQPRVLVDNAIARTLFEGSPYGESLLGTESSVASITSQSLKALYRATVAPAESFVVVVGNTTQSEVTASLEKAFGNWKSVAPARQRLRPASRQSKKIRVIDRKGSAQSTLAVTTVGVSRTTKDFDAVLIGNTILGGMFSSRLNLNLREKHAFTYGAYSMFDMRRGPGPFVATAAVDTPNTGAAIKEILNEINTFRSSRVTEEELRLALGRQVKSLPGRFQSATTTARSIAALGVFGLANDEYRQRPGRLERVTPAQVQEMASNRLNPNELQIIVAGDLSVIRPQLMALAYGVIEIIDPSTSKVLETIADSP